MPDLTAAELSIPTEQNPDPAKPLVVPVDSPVVSSTRRFIPDAWEEFCGVMNTTPLRQASYVREYPARESKLLGLSVLWIYPRLRPRSRADRWAILQCCHP